MAESLAPEISRVSITGGAPSTALDAAHQTLRDLRDEQIQDVETALRKLADERRRFELIDYKRKFHKRIPSSLGMIF